MEWTEEDDKKLFGLYKCFGTVWSMMTKEFPGRDQNQIKNRFYSTLRRVATKKISEGKLPYKKSIEIGTNELLKYVDDAIEYGHCCFSKRGKRSKPESSIDPCNKEKVIEVINFPYSINFSNLIPIYFQKPKIPFPSAFFAEPYKSDSAFKKIDKFSSPWGQ